MNNTDSTTHDRPTRAAMYLPRPDHVECDQHYGDLLADQHDWIITGEFAEPTKREGSAWREMLDAITAGTHDAVVVATAYGMSRNAADVARMRQEVAALGVPMICDGQVLSPAAADFTAHLLSTFAELESQARSERMKAVWAKKRREAAS